MCLVHRLTRNKRQRLTSPHPESPFTESWFLPIFCLEYRHSVPTLLISCYTQVLWLCKWTNYRSALEINELELIPQYERCHTSMWRTFTDQWEAFSFLITHTVNEYAGRYSCTIAWFLSIWPQKLPGWIKEGIYGFVSLMKNVSG